MRLKVTLNKNRNFKNIVVLLDTYHLSPTCHSFMYLIMIKIIIYMIISGPNIFLRKVLIFLYPIIWQMPGEGVCVAWQSMFDITVTCYLRCPDG